MNAISTEFIATGFALAVALIVYDLRSMVLPDWPVAALAAAELR